MYISTTFEIRYVYVPTIASLLLVTAQVFFQILSNADFVQILFINFNYNFRLCTSMLLLFSKDVKVGTYWFTSFAVNVIIAILSIIVMGKKELGSNFKKNKFEAYILRVHFQNFSGFVIPIENWVICASSSYVFKNGNKTSSRCVTKFCFHCRCSLSP